MSAYDNDPRVKRDGDDFLFDHWQMKRPTRRAVAGSDGMYSLFVEDIPMGSALYADADTAIRSVIGDPQ